MEWLGWMAIAAAAWLFHRESLKKHDREKYALEQRIRDLENALEIERDLRD